MGLLMGCKLYVLVYLCFFRAGTTARKRRTWHSTMTSPRHHPTKVPSGQCYQWTVPCVTVSGEELPMNRAPCCPPQPRFSVFLMTLLLGGGALGHSGQQTCHFCVPAAEVKRNLGTATLAVLDISSLSTKSRVWEILHSNPQHGPLFYCTLVCSSVSSCCAVEYLCLIRLRADVLYSFRLMYSDPISQ